MKRQCTAISTQLVDSTTTFDTVSLEPATFQWHSVRPCLNFEGSILKTQSTFPGWVEQEGLLADFKIRFEGLCVERAFPELPFEWITTDGVTFPRYTSRALKYQPSPDKVRAFLNCHDYALLGVVDLVAMDTFAHLRANQWQTANPTFNDKREQTFSFAQRRARTIVTSMDLLRREWKHDHPPTLPLPIHRNSCQRAEHRQILLDTHRLRVEPRTCPTDHMLTFGDVEIWRAKLGIQKASLASFYVAGGAAGDPVPKFWWAKLYARAVMYTTRNMIKNREIGSMFEIPRLSANVYISPVQEVCDAFEERYPLHSKPIVVVTEEAFAAAVNYITPALRDTSLFDIIIHSSIDTGMRVTTIPYYPRRCLNPLASHAPVAGADDGWCELMAKSRGLLERFREGTEIICRDRRDPGFVVAVPAETLSRGQVLAKIIRAIDDNDTPVLVFSLYQQGFQMATMQNDLRDADIRAASKGYVALHVCFLGVQGIEVTLRGNSRRETSADTRYHIYHTPGDFVGHHPLLGILYAFLHIGTGGHFSLQAEEIMIPLPNISNRLPLCDRDVVSILQGIMDSADCPYRRINMTKSRKMFQACVAATRRTYAGSVERYRAEFCKSIVLYFHVEVGRLALGFVLGVLDIQCNLPERADLDRRLLVDVQYSEEDQAIFDKILASIGNSTARDFPCMRLPKGRWGAHGFIFAQDRRFSLSRRLVGLEFDCMDEENHLAIQDVPLPPVHHLLTEEHLIPTSEKLWCHGHMKQIASSLQRVAAGPSQLPKTATWQQVHYFTLWTFTNSVERVKTTDALIERHEIDCSWGFGARMSPRRVMCVGHTLTCAPEVTCCDALPVPSATACTMDSVEQRVETLLLWFGNLVKPHVVACAIALVGQDLARAPGVRVCENLDISDMIRVAVRCHLQLGFLGLPHVDYSVTDSCGWRRQREGWPTNPAQAMEAMMAGFLMFTIQQINIIEGFVVRIVPNAIMIPCIPRWQPIRETTREQRMPTDLFFEFTEGRYSPRMIVGKWFKFTSCTGATMRELFASFVAIMNKLLAGGAFSYLRMLCCRMATGHEQIPEASRRLPTSVYIEALVAAKACKMMFVDICPTRANSNHFFVRFEWATAVIDRVIAESLVALTFCNMTFRYERYLMERSDPTVLHFDGNQESFLCLWDREFNTRLASKKPRFNLLLSDEMQ
jgi:hypothetical protein